MKEQLTPRNFGLLIAYLVPGFTAVWGAGFRSDTVMSWLGQVDGARVGGFLFVTIASIAAGMILSALRWLSVDQLHHLSGVRPCHFNDSELTERLPGYIWIVENHYRYHQFYGHMLLALLFAHLMWRTGDAVGPGISVDMALVVIDVSLFAGSRSALQRYYRRTEALLHARESEVHNDQRRSPQRRTSEPAAESDSEPVDCDRRASPGSVDSGTTE